MNRSALRSYKDEEVNEAHCSSKWNGKTAGIKGFDGKMLCSGEIAEIEYTSPFIVMHGQLHFRSIAHLDDSVYKTYCVIEEATVN